jgi:uncharacterized membrane protein
LPEVEAVSLSRRGQWASPGHEGGAVKDWLILATNVAVDAIDWLALILIVVGAVEAFFLGLWTMFASHDGHHERDVWLRLGRWLVAGLTFQLAADVLETAVTTSWDEVARLAAIAAIRTFLNYFLERDLGEIRERQAITPSGPPPPAASDRE